MLMCRYQRRLSIATSALEKQNLELELARKLVENAAITRNKLMMSSAWAMQSADKKFRIQEKLQSGCLKGTDIQKQQLYALSLQSNQGNSLLTRLELDLTLFPSNENVARELLNVVLTDSAHPVNAALNHMQHRVDQLLKSLMTESGATDGYTSGRIDTVAQVIKDDLNVLQDVLTATFDPLNSDRNSSITSEVVNHVYLSKLKTNIVSLLRVEMTEEEVRLSNKMRESSEIFCHLPENVEREAKNKLHYLTTLHNPYEMLDCTVHIVKLLATCKFDHEHSTSMGADDLLPRLCQILINSALPEINAEAAFMEIFMPAEKALGEEGYALTTLQSAIAHLSSLPNNDH